MDATTDPVQEFLGEVVEGTDADEVSGSAEALPLVELVDGESFAPDSSSTRSSDEDLTGTRSRGNEGQYYGLSDAERLSVMADNLLSDEARFARWQGRRPPVSHLQPAVIWPPGESEAVPLFDVGSRVVVEQRVRFLEPRVDPTDEGRAVRYPWLRTKVIRVTKIDDETGACEGINEDQGMVTRRVHFRYNDLEVTSIYLAPPVGVDPFDVTTILAERREAERKKARLIAGLPGAPMKRGRGRPPGAKNRPKDVIAAEKELYRKSVEERRNLRKAKRGGR